MMSNDTKTGGLRPVAGAQNILARETAQKV